MLKGVNKQILEVTNPDNEYFEKIIFFVRSNSPAFEEAKLKYEAEKISKTATKPPKTKPNFKGIARILAYSLMSATIGIGLSLLIGRIF